jgi:NitT/TauT family transport system substrate-binding protein
MVRRGVCAGVLAAMLAAAVAAALAQPKPLEKVTLLMPEPHGHTFRVVYLGIEKGWFANEGIEIDFKTIPGGAVNIVPQLAQGAGDIGWAGGYTVIQARAKGAPIVGINSASAESLWGVITRKESGIRAPRDLRGKTIGVVAFSSATHFMTLALLRAGGLTESDANIRPIGLGGAAALSQKQIDGYVWFKTQGLALETRGTPVHVLDVDQFIPLPQDLMLSTEQTIRARGPALRAYLRVLKRAADYEFATQNYAEGDAALKKYAPESVLDTTFLRALQGYTRARTERDHARKWRWGSTDPVRLERAQDFLHEIKVIERRTPVKDMFTNDLLPE